MVYALGATWSRKETSVTGRVRLRTGRSTEHQKDGRRLLIRAHCKVNARTRLTWPVPPRASQGRKEAGAFAGCPESAEKWSANSVRGTNTAVGGCLNTARTAPGLTRENPRPPVPVTAGGYVGCPLPNDVALLVIFRRGVGACRRAPRTPASLSRRAPGGRCGRTWGLRPFAWSRGWRLLSMATRMATASS
jgi:hypothetical protein